MCVFHTEHIDNIILDLSALSAAFKNRIIRTYIHKLAQSLQFPGKTNSKVTSEYGKKKKVYKLCVYVVSVKKNGLSVLLYIQTSTFCSPFFPVLLPWLLSHLCFAVKSWRIPA